MMAAKLFHDRIDKLILIEPNPFSLLRALGHDANYNEVMALYDCIKLNRANGDWEIAGAVFANYWNGAGTWEAMGTDRKAKFSKALEPNFHEWNAVINEQTSINEWATFLPSDTTVLKCTKTVQSINDVVKLMRSATKNWRFIDYDEGGHMAPLTKPDLINPIIANALQSLE